MSRNDHVTHTGHLLYGVFITGSESVIPCLAEVSDGAAKVAQALDDTLPEGLVHQERGDSRFSEAYVATLRHSVLNAQARGSVTISVLDVLRGLLIAGPNVATHILDLLAIDRTEFTRQLEGY